MTATQTPQVVDASLVAAAFLDSTPEGVWALQQLTVGPLVAPHLMQFEVANIVRRTTQRGAISVAEGRMALHDLDRLTLTLVPFDRIADRVWELRDNLTAYDAAYVATAELMSAPLVTLDRRIGRAPGITCQVLSGPPAS